MFKQLDHSGYAQTSNHYKDTFKSRFKFDSKLTTKEKMKAQKTYIQVSTSV